MSAQKGVPLFFQQLVNGLTIGSTYALVTIGFSMVWSILQLTNFAHSSFYMLAAYIALTIMTAMGGSKWAFLVAFLISIVLTAMLGATMERFCLRPIREKKALGIATMLCTVGIQSAMNNAIIVFFGSETKSFPDVLKLGSFHIGDVIVSWLQVLIFVAALVLMIVMSLIVYKTKLGAAMRAISQNPEAANLMGINVNQVIMITFFLGIFVASIAGIMVGMYYGAVDTTMAAATGSKSMAAAVLGGIGSLPGAMLGGVIIGVMETFVASYISSGYRDAIAFAILILVLLIRPAGMFGKKAVNKV